LILLGRVVKIEIADETAEFGEVQRERLVLFSILSFFKSLYFSLSQRPDYPNRLRMANLIRELATGAVEERYAHVDGSIPIMRSPHPDRETDPTGIRKKWIATLPDFTMLLYTDGSKLEDDRIH
jgi:hypothetical protein